MNNPDTDDNSLNPINLDVEQQKELERLIDSLKKEIVFPAKKRTEKAPASTSSRQ
jgi:hypothetical protein